MMTKTGPFVLRGINRLAEVLALPRLARIAPERFLAKAAHAVGFQGSPDPRLREALEVLAAASNAQPRLTPFGRLFLATTVQKRLVNRFGVDRALQALSPRPVTAPVFIVSLPRTGTTLLHRLLNHDPRFRTLRTWEMDHPVPPPDPATRDTDPRIRRAKLDAAILDWIAPDFKAIHEVGPELPEECINLFANDLESVWFLVGVDLPDYRNWLNKRDLRPLYARHRLQLQLLQSRFPPTQRWVLKAPMHLLGLSALLSTYPDAKIIMTHRDPARVVASEASLFVTMRRAFHDDVEPNAVGRELLDDLSTWASRAAAARRAADPSQFLDLSYEDLARNPIGAVDTIYRWLGMPFLPEVRERMTQHFHANRQHKHGPHPYALADFGLREEEVREQFPPSLPLAK